MFIYFTIFSKSKLLNDLNLYSHLVFRSCSFALTHLCFHGEKIGKRVQFFYDFFLLRNRW
jgi:hypothetical protein